MLTPLLMAFCLCGAAALPSAADAESEVMLVNEPASERYTRGRLGSASARRGSLVAEELKLADSQEKPPDEPFIADSDWTASLKKFGRSLVRRGRRMFVDHLFRVRVTSIDGCYYTAEDEILSILNSNNGAEPFVWTLMDLNPAVLLKGHPWIRDVKLNWEILPLRLSLDVEEVEPWLVADYRGQSWLVSRQGTLIEPLEAIGDSDLILEASKLPRLGGLALSESSFSSLRSPNARLNYALRYLELLKAAGGLPFQVERYTLLPQGGMRVSPVDFFRHPEVLLDFDSYDKARDAVDKLRIVLRDLAKRGEKPAEIDLRFDRQAIVRN